MSSRGLSQVMYMYKVHVKISWNVLTHPTKGTAEIPSLIFVLCGNVSFVPSASFSPPVLVSSSDLIRCVYHFEYTVWVNACDTESD